ncbi:MAG: dephospho-CoA kinase [Candidatus Cloacimonetes bacterium]|nr:dephospho-CoA kinase [Candidatus Cloacimonadota bacterium]
MKQSDRPFLIAVTGGIAAGKSVVSSWFEKHNLKVIYADKLGHELLRDNKILSQISDLFGKEIIKDNEIDRKKLGKMIFNSEIKRKELNKLLHPKILEEIDELIKKSREKILLFEIALLFENNLEQAFDMTINVSADEKIKLRRIIKRDNITIRQAKKRIKTQMSDQDKKKISDINLMNNGSLEELYSELNKLLPIIKTSDKKNLSDIRKI